jgi:hypothetical protein
MSANLDKVIDRIRKLLALASSANENEAQAAAGLAAKLQEEYQIEAAQIQLDTGEEIDDAIVPEVWVEGTNRAKWKDYILSGLCTLHNVKLYHGKARRDNRKAVSTSNLFGRTSAIQTVKYSLDMFVSVGDKSAEEGYATYLRNASPLGYIENKKAWGNSFRVGFATRIYQRLQELAKANQKYREQGISSGNQALLVVAKNDLAVNDAYKDFLRSKGVHLKNGSGGGSRISNGSGYAAGQAAGNGVSLGGGRGQLGAGPGLLR